ncbi:hypothetical protein EW145_g646 [Phellinidium pouzarii]|uniref:Autophagy-related protein 11 n=1 Tax=Phellinidium pouzarii TaxID=167371 RepID=A0A4S4LI34_9AGAM|nr:hypothetical protein EW145_g646 [Phellinidium pouzarii]
MERHFRSIHRYGKLKDRSSTLEQFLQDEIGIDQEAILAYLSDGRRLTNENLRDLAGAPDNTIFVFNKYYLDYDLHEVLRELRVQPHFQPPIEDAISSTPPFRPHRLAAAYLQAAHVHSDIVSHIAASVRLQLDALSIASRSLDLNILSLSEAFEPFAQSVGHALNKQALLLTTLDSDLAAVAAVRIHPEFLSAAARRAIESGDRARTLGDYVSNDKMRQVADVCAKNSEGLRMRFEQVQECMERLSNGADQVRLTLQNARLLENAGSSERRAQDASKKVTDIASRLESVTGPALSSDGLLLELKQTDAILRKEVETVTDIKACVINADLVQLPSMMSSIQADIRVKTSFAHIQRLHNMIYAYGATLIEIVRRKEFARFFYQRAQTILEVMAKLTSAERKRQQIYRGEVHGQLPFDAKGMDDTVPAIDFSPSGGRDSEYSLDRSDVETFMQTLDEFERSIQNDPQIPMQPLQETRKALEKLIDRMDSIESSFDRIVERSLLSSSRISLSRRRLTEADEAAFQELADRVAALEHEKGERESSIKKEREKYEDEIAQLKAELRMHTESAGEGREHTERLMREMRSLKAQNDSESQARQILEQRQTELLADVEALRKGHADALNDVANRAHEADALRLELVRSQEEHAEAKQLKAEHSAKIAQLLTDQTGTLHDLQEARLRGEDLQMQIEIARAENEEAKRALRESGEQKEHLLHAQALEHDRIMRDHIAEADGDRAVLEQRFFEARTQLDQNERQLKEAHARIDISHADAAGLREELQRTEHELREARHIERVLRNDLSEGRASQSDFEQKIGDRDRLVAQILDVGIALRDSHTKAFSTLQPLSVHPATALKNGTNPSESVILSPPRLSMPPLREEATPIDPTDPAAALEILRAYDLDAFSEIVVKVCSVVRKWQKQCREYRERAKGKITFRNFAKGDLALFLPTRNSVSKPWAAFNVSFPHYFLNAAGRLAEQLKTREWIVARITSITEKIADARDPSSNPYGLGDGIKYFMLEVEDWTRPGAEATKRRKSTSNKLNQDRPTSPTPLERPISPPLADIPQPGASAAEPLGPTRSPTSHLFPVRTRSNSASAGPSSLSKLLAQATPAESPLEVTLATPLRSRSRTPSPTSRFAGPPPPSPTRVAALAHSPNMPSPLRPGSRASGSSSSRLSFSGGRIAPFPRGPTSGTPVIVSKAAPTTALSSENPVNSVNSPPTPSSVSSGGVVTNNPAGNRNADKQSGRRNSRSIRTSTPSPTHSASEGMSNILLGRRRTTSEHVFPATVTNVKSNNRQSVRTVSPSVGTSTTSALANFASTLGMSMSIGRRKKAVADSETVIHNGTGTSRDNADVSVSGSDTGSPTNDANGDRLSFTPASQLLKKF